MLLFWFMAYRSPLEIRVGLVTNPDTPPFSNRHHPVSCIARCGVARKQDRAAQPQTHSRATTTPRVRRAIQLSEEKNIALAKRYGVFRNGRPAESTSDARMGPTNPRASILTQDDEAIILAYRWRTRLPLDDCLDQLRRLMPKLSRSALYRCLRCRGLGRIGSTASSPPLNSPIGERRSVRRSSISLTSGHLALTGSRDRRPSPAGHLGRVIEQFYIQ